MRKFIPALKIALIVCIVFLAAVTILGLIVGADRPFAPALPILFGLISLGLLSASTLATPDCPACGSRQPAQRKPTSLRQAIFGGWTCARCGTELDRRGAPI
jgi:DNA-directed RNA polymerase subunit RPC12/RpoP